MWQLHVCRSYYSNQNCLFHSFPVTASSAMFSQLHEMPGAKKQNRRIIFFLNYVIASMADMELIEHQRQQNFQPTQKHLKSTMFLKFRENFKRPQFAKLRLLRCPHFLRVFLPFVLLGSACGLASGRGSRGYTPLHLAARAGHDSVVERLLEAKAAVDAKDKDSRGLG